MKIDYKPNTVTTNATFDESMPTTFDEDSLSHIFRVLTDIYSKPAESVTREYAANGLDSHILAGQTKPVEVTFPTYLNASFIVKDYGVGMSRDDLINVYRKYGASTKRDSNDQIGAFGLGAKSALALTNSFTVTAVKDGKRNVIIITKDEEGGSTMNFLEEKDTDEENGVTVTVPVPNTRDFAQVERLNIFIGWKPGTVLVNGKEPDSIYNADVYKQLGDFGWYETGANAAGSQYGNLRAVVGPVSYEIPRDVTQEVLKKFEGQAPINTLTQRLVLNIPNGSVAITPNREDLIFNNRTKQKITDILTEAVPLVLEYAAGALAAAPDRKSAAEIAEALYRQGLLAVGDVTWQGETFAKVTGNGYGKNFKFTYANAELDRDEDDETRLFASEMYNSYSSKTGAYVLRVRHSNGVVNSFMGNHRFMLITEAARNKRGEFESNPRINTWAKAEGLESVNGNRSSAIVYTTTRKLSELPTFMVALAAKTATAAEVIEIAKANAEPKAPRVPRVAAATSLTITVPGGHRDKKDMIETVTQDKLDAERKYVLAQATGPNGEGGAVTFENAIYSYFRAPNNGNVLTGTTEMLRAAGDKGYVFVILPATADRDKVSAVLPNTHTIDSAFADMFAFDGTEAQQDYLALVMGGKVSSARWGLNLNTNILFDKAKGNLISQVKDATSREFLTLFQSYDKDARRIEAFGRFYRNVQTAQEDIKAVGPLTVAAFTKSDAIFNRDGRSYLLILNGIFDGAEQDAVDYINLCDARRNNA